MKCITRRTASGMYLGTMAVLVSACLTVPTPAVAQDQGYNAVYNLAGNKAVSASFFDASMFIGTGNTQSPTICGAIYGILSGGFLTPPQTFTSGSVVDARGISGATALTCGAGTTPWSQDGNGYVLNVPSTILLPAGTIVIPTKWVLPSNTHLVGEGSTLSGGLTPGTALQVSSSFTANTPMIQFGSSSGCCSGISVEKLALDGIGTFVNGIENGNAGDSSYVDHVVMNRILGTGLWVHGMANNSGPYSPRFAPTLSVFGLMTSVLWALTWPALRSVAFLNSQFGNQPPSAPFSC
jgi:hypothetical protein